MSDLLYPDYDDYVWSEDWFDDTTDVQRYYDGADIEDEFEDYWGEREYRD